MKEAPDETPPARTKGRLLVAAAPSGDDLERAADIPANQCPQRYCWWWRSLGFDWEMPLSEGCTFLTSPKPRGTANPSVPCSRCVSASTVDHYEPREPHLLEDGFVVARWHSAEHLHTNGEISYDLVMENDMEFVEGTYRIGGCEWSVVVFTKYHMESVSWKTATWQSGVSGIVVQVPIKMRLNVATVESLLSDILGVTSWDRVRGPDSMGLR
jgi:hypothetical protein